MSAPAGEIPPMTRAQSNRVHALIAKARPGQDRHSVMAELLGRGPITTANELTVDDADRIIDALDRELRERAS